MSASDDVSLRDYLETCLKSLEDKIENQSEFIAQHFELNEKAIKKAEEAMQIRLEGMNEFRSQINMERMNYLTRDNYSVIHEELCKRVEKLETTNSFSAGKMWMVMAGFAAIPTILALLALFTER